jgi:hypothetical protein
LEQQVQPAAEMAGQRYLVHEPSACHVKIKFLGQNCAGWHGFQKFSPSINNKLTAGHWLATPWVHVLFLSSTKEIECKL